MIRKADTPEARKFWAEVEKAASYCPEWAKPHIEAAVKEQVKEIRRHYEQNISKHNVR